MAERAVFGIARDEDEAVDLLNQLRSAGVPPKKISLLFSPAEEEGSPAGGDVKGALGALDWLTFAVFEVEGLGPVVAAGPIVATLNRAPRAALAGSDGALAEAGVSLEAAERYQARIREGEVVIAVHTEDADDETRVREIVHRSRPHDVDSTTPSAHVRWSA